MPELEQRPYQQEGTEFHFTHPRSMNGDEMGLGKTNQLLMASKRIQPKSKLTVCSRSALYTWVRESRLWVPELPEPVVVQGTREQRQVLWHSPYVIATHGALREDLAYVMHHRPHFDVIEDDEAHKHRNRKSQLWAALKQLDSDYLFQASGSFVARGAQDLWSHLNLCDPKMFSSYWKFVNTFCWVEDSQFGKDIIANKNVPELKEILKHYLILRTKKQVGSFIPPKTRQYIELDMLPVERRMYDKLEKDFILELDEFTKQDTGKILMSSTKLGTLIKLRQMLVSPQILEPSLPVGSTITLIGEWLKDQDEANQHVVIFCPFKTGLDILQKHLTDIKIKQPILRLQGGCGVKEIEYAEETFRTGKGILISTTQFAQSWSVETAKAVWMAGCDYDPEINKQAEARAHRFTTDHPLTVYYTGHRGTFEDRVFEILNDKNRSSTEITQMLGSALGLKNLVRR